MIKINIKSNNQITHSAIFETEQLALSWKNSQPSNAFPQNSTHEIIDISTQLLAKQESDAALKYLAETDYMVIRKSETGQDYPQEIKDLRAAARLKVL